MKEQEMTMNIDLSETDISKMPNREFQIFIIKVLDGLEKQSKPSVRPLTPR